MDTLFQNVLTASFHGSIVIAVVILLRCVLKKTPKKFLCFLWLLAGLRLLMPFEIQSAFSLQPEPVQLEQQFLQPLPEKLPMVSQQEILNYGTVQKGDAQPLPQPTQAAAEVVPEQQQTSVPSLPQTVEATPTEPTPFIDWAALVPWFWLSIASCFGIYTVYCYLRLSYQVREAIKIPGGWECENIDTAFILGFIRPRIYIPMGMSRNVRRHILAHERTHLEKGDHWFKMIGFLALAVHWFNPLVWVAYVMLCKDIEMACDERVVQFMDLEERKSYSAALLSCSANRAHLAACPVAFGEVSVKDRIKSVLNYRKPSFWISLAGVVAIFFVALCLLTNPIQETPAAGETLPTETVETEPLTEEQREERTRNKEAELFAKVDAGLRALLKGEDTAYSLLGVDDDGSVYWQYHVQKQGKDQYWHLTDWRNGSNVERSLVILDGVCYEYENPVWLPGSGEGMEDPGVLAAPWFDWSAYDSLYNYQEVETTRAEGISYHQIKFNAIGQEPLARVEYIFEFGEEGELLNAEILGLESPYGKRIMLSNEGRNLSIQEEMGGGSVFDEARESIMTWEEYESTKIPSNRLDYDRDFMLGSGQMRWHFFDGGWQFACGAEDATATGLTMFYCESGDNHHSLTADEGFWLETLADGRWQYVNADIQGKAAAEEIQVSWNTTDRVNISWADTYGSLAPGFYRLGRFHTVTMPNGDTETTHTYAKFRIYDGDKDTLLESCRVALENLKGGNYHIFTFDWMPDTDHEYYLSAEYWKLGEDYVEVTRYPLREDTSEMWNVNTFLWRDGMGYKIDWEGSPMASEIKEWTLNRPGYMDGSNRNLWTFGLEWYDAKVTEVYQEGSSIHIIENYDFSDQYECTDLTFALDDYGNVMYISKSYLPSRSDTSQRVVSLELTVFNSSPEELRKVIDSIDLSQPMAFDYAQEEAAHPDAQKIGFKNNTPKPIETPADALALAHEECTLPQLMEFEKGYCQSQTYYDEATDMWKVHLFWHQHDTAQSIYMNSQGITKMIVTVG